MRFFLRSLFVFMIILKSYTYDCYKFPHKASMLVYPPIYLFCVYASLRRLDLIRMCSFNVISVLD